MSSSTPTPSSQPTEITVGNIVEAPVDKTELAALSYELELKQVDLDRQVLLNHELRQNIAGRGNWGVKVFWLLSSWLVAVIGVVVCQGFVIRGFHLDDSVVIAFISTTTVNVLSLGYIVCNYLFPKQK